MKLTGCTILVTGGFGIGLSEALHALEPNRHHRVNTVAIRLNAVAIL